MNKSMEQLDWVKKFQKVISTDNQNSYKFAIGMAIVEIGKKEITYQELAEKLSEYYYRNVIRFRIRETTNINQSPKAHQIVIEHFNNKEDTRKFTKYDKKEIAKKFVNIENFSNSVFYYVLPCWEGAKNNKYPTKDSNSFFEYSKDYAKITLKEEFLKTIESNRQLLLDLAVLEWVRFLEKFNNIPNLVNKISYKKPNRRLQTFTKFFKSMVKDSCNICYICGNVINKDNDLTLDHVIPFDYMWSDDLWNLVPAHKKCNSSKNMCLGNNDEFDRLSKMIDNFYECYKKNIENKCNNECKPTKCCNEPCKFLHDNLISQFENKNDLINKINEIKQHCINIGYMVYESKTNTNQIQ